MATSTRRIKGSSAAIYFNGTKILDIHDANIQIDPEFLESKGWEKNWKSRTVDGCDWKISGIKKYNRTANAGQLLARAALGSPEQNPIMVSITLAGTEIIRGPGFVGSTSMSLADGQLAIEDCEIVAADEPDSVAGVTPIP